MDPIEILYKLAPALGVWTVVLLVVALGLFQLWQKILLDRVTKLNQEHYDLKIKPFESQLIEQRQKLLFVHEKQFNKEFEIYVELWEKLVELRKTLEVLKELLKDNHSKIEQMKKDLNAVYKDYFHVFMKNKPFYYSVIYDSCISLNGVMADTFDDISKTIYGNIKQTDLRNFLLYRISRSDEFIDNICKSIRHRILIVNDEVS
jgi:hypothetical protein